jgi:pyruvate,water dikinase
MALDHMTARLTKKLIGLALLVKNDTWLTDVFTFRNYEAIFARGNGKRQAVRVFRTRFRSLLKVWGRRNGIGYGSAWKPTDPTWNMNPEIPLDSIGSFVRQDLDSLRRSHIELVQKRKAAIRAVRKEIGQDKKLRKEFEFELFRVTNRVQMMENHNYLIEQRTFGEYRESINRAGVSLTREGFIDTPDDIFYLGLAQLESAAESDDYSGLRSLVLQAKYEEVENSKLIRPDFLGTKPPDPEKESGDGQEPLRGLSEDGQILQGEPSSAGSFTGTARVVITRTSRPPDIKKGDILVTENTGPDWVPIFPLIGGLILDGGDNFQHASLISREYGIPCVIQSKEATKIIADGQLVTVDGSAGTVTLNPMV